MKTDKITRMLIMYSMLIKGNRIHKSLFSMEHEINERSFDRDIEDIRLFLSDSFSTDELVYDKAENAYYLTGQSESSIDAGEAYVLAKSLLGSNVLRRDELEGLLASLVSMVNKKDAKILQIKLTSDIKEYDDGKHEKAILKFIRDLSNCVYENRHIRMKYITSRSKVDCIEVYPKEIKCQNSQFLLYASENRNGETKKYLIDKIEEFENIR